MRSIPEWIGKTDDERVPPHVRVRIFDRYHGICYLSGRKIRPGDKWDLEHIKALCNGGEHRENNMAPALVGAHKEKTKQDRRIKSKNDHVRMSHLGVKKPRSIRCWKKFDGTPVYASRER